MCTLAEKKHIEKVFHVEHLELVLLHNCYGIFRDADLELWYFARIDKHFKPLELYDGSKDAVNDMFKAYIETGRLFWKILE